jgi:hypothetical protein
MKNGLVTGSGTSYTYTPASGDSVTCILTSSQLCTVGTAAAGNTIHLFAAPSGPAGISISANPGDTICDGETVTFSAAATLAGTAPAYQWTKNSVPAGTGGSTYTYAPANGDYIQCTLTSNDVCATPASGISNTVNIVSGPIVSPSVSLTGPAGANTGDIVTIAATVVNAGSSYLLYWMNHGIVFTTTTVPSVTYTKTAGIDTITAKVVSTAVSGCFDSTSSMGHLVTTTTGINDLQHAIIIAINPNPAHNELSIVANRRISAVTISSLPGQVVYSHTFNAEKAEIDISKLAPGMYTVKVTDNEGTVTVRKIIKQ